MCIFSVLRRLSGIRGSIAKIPTAIGLVIMIGVCCGPAMAEQTDHNTYTTISTLVPFSNDVPSGSPDAHGVLLVGFANVDWLPSTCNQGYVYVDADDYLLSSVLISAFHDSKTVRPIVELSVKLDDKYCKLVYAFVK